MAKSRNFLRSWWATIFVAAVCGGILFGGGIVIDPDCDQEDLHMLFVLGSVCGGEVSPSAAEDWCGCKFTITSNSAAPGALSRLSFEYNLGQADARYGFVSRISSTESVLLRADEAVISGSRGMVKAKFENARASASAEPSEPLAGHINYILGNRPEQWVTDVPTFRSVTYKQVYPGIDIQYSGQGSQLEHDFIVQPGADPARIRFRFEGAERVTVNGSGDVLLMANGREIQWKKPRVYQSRKAGTKTPIEGRYRLNDDGAVGFELGAYDPRHALVIDPVVAFSTYLGGNTNDSATRNAVDPSGNVYVTGRTLNVGFPVTPGFPTQLPTSPVDSSVIVSKMKPDGSGLVYSTLIGGSSFDLGLGIAADASGNVYVAGYTISGDFPVTNGAFATRPAGSNPNITRRGDCFVLKLNPAGNALVYSTYLPGADADACLALAIDSTGNAYVTGLTRSSDFPRTDGVFQQRFNLTGGDQVEAFVAKLNPTGSSLVYSSLLGGPGVDVGTGIAVDSSGNAYVTGFTSSATGFPVTLGAFQTRFRATGSLPVGRERDAFAVKVNPSGSALLYGTYLGGSGDDMGFGIAIDSQGTAVICGNAMSADFPVTSPTYQASNRGAGGQERPEVASGDAFVAKLNAQGSALLFSTFLGGSKDDRATACALDTSGRVMVTGYTLSPDFPVTGDAAQRAYGGSAGKHFSSGDAFFAQLSANGTALLYSTYLGGAADEAAVGLSVDGSGSSFISGGTGSSNFLATSGAFQRVFGGMGRGSASQYVYGDGFVTKFGPADGSGAGSAPSIASLSDAASYVGGAVAPGEIVVLTGTAIGPAQLATAALASPDSLSNLVAETRVLFDDVPSPIIYVSAGQTAVVVPFTVAGRQSTAVVAEYKGVRSPAITVPVVAFKPALFTANASGRGPVAALNQDNSINSASNGAARGSVIQLFGTGSGQTQPPSVDGRLSINVVPRIALPVTITIAGITADVLYAGAAPGAVAGLFQMNVAIPVTTPSGDQPITVRIGDSATAQSGVTVAVR